VRREGLALLVLALAIAAAPSAARGQQPTGAAELYRLGVEAYDRQDYARAAQLFSDCHARSGDPSLLFNIAQAHRLAGDCEAAAGHYRRFLEAMPEAPNRADAEAKLADMERCARERSEPEPEPAPAAPPITEVREAPRDRRPASPAGLWVAAGGGLVLGASAFFWYRAWDADRELDRLWEEGGVYDQHQQALADRMKSSRTIAIVTTAAGAAAVAGGLVYHFFLRPRPERPTAVVQPTPGGAMFVVACEL
jgi:tetratricopeptide (TPR) repeat protein